MIPPLSILRYFTVNFIPILIIILYVLDQYISIPSWIYITPLLGNIIFTVITLSAWIANIPRQTFFSFGWRYESALLYPLYFFINWIILHRKTNSIKLASMGATLSTIAVGWLYEIPLYLTHDITRPFFHISYPFFFSSRMIAFIFLIALLKTNGWKYTKNTETLIIALFFFSLVWIFVLLPLPSWIFPKPGYRIPAMALMTSLSAEINGAIFE